MGELIVGVFCVLAVPTSIGIWIGYVLRGRKQLKHPDGTSAQAGITAPETDSYPGRSRWLADQLDQEPLRSILSDEQRQTIRDHYFPQVPLPTQTATPPVASATITPTQPLAPPPSPVYRPAFVTTGASDEAVPVVIADPKPSGGYAESPLAPAAEPKRNRVEWDPAVLLLYLGAFLVVAAGLVYASYNWADLDAWQKLGMLLAATIAFAGSGLVLLSRERVRPAAETFIAIGALLVPANAVAAYTVLEKENVRTELIVLLGALVTTLVYALFSRQPGGVIYSYGAVIAGSLAIASLLPALGTHAGWGLTVLLLAIALVPDVRDRLDERWRHLRQPLFRVGVVELPLAAFGGVAAASDTTDWVLPATLLASTIALSRFARRTTNPVPGIACTLTAIGTVAGTLFAFDVELPAVWTVAAIATSFALIAVAERGPAWVRTRFVRLALSIESVVGFAIAAPIAIASSEWWFSGSLIAGIAGIALIARLRNERWWLVGAGLFAAVFWFSLPGLVDVTDLEMRVGFLYAIPLPLLLGAVAFALDRWSARTERVPGSWGEPLWSVAGLVAIVVTALPVAWYVEDGTSILPELAVACALFGITSLIAAWSTGRALVRIAYGIWSVIAIIASALTLPIIDPDRLALVLVATTILASLSVPPLTRVVERLTPVLRVQDPGKPPAELFVFAATIAVALLAMLGVTLRYVTGQGERWIPGDPGVRWTWIVYLAIYIAIAAGAAWIGYRVYQRPDGTLDSPAPVARWLPETALTFAGISALLTLRMFTTDPIIWSWAGLIAATALFGCSQLVRERPEVNPFLERLGVLGRYAGLGLGALSILGNLNRAFDPELNVNNWIQAGIYLVTGLVSLALAFRGGQIFMTFIGFGALALASIFVVRGFEGSVNMTVLTLIVFAWVIAGMSLALPRNPRWAIHQPAWITSAIGIGALATAITIYQNESPRLDSRDWQMLVISLVSLAGLVAVDAMVRRDPVRGTIASAIAMLALLFEIAVDDPSNIQAYTIPLAVYLLALGFVQRRNPKIRDILLGMGSAVLLVPALLLALREETFDYLMLAGGEALVLFIGGVILRLRVTIAAGVAAITLIVLRMLVDAVNALPSWITLLVVGVVLLTVGTVLLIWKEAFRERLLRLQAGWHEMG